MKKYTFNSRWEAFRNYQNIDFSDRVIIPDQVADNQADFDGKTFPAIEVLSGKKIRVKLVGDDYDLHGSGTGDMCVRPA